MEKFERRLTIFLLLVLWENQTARQGDIGWYFIGFGIAALFSGAPWIVEWWANRRNART